MATEKNLEQLLKKLSVDKKPYPKDLLDARRATYLSQVSSVAGSGPHLNKGNGQGGSPPASASMTPLMKIILGTLIVANIALATYLAVYLYENWDKAQELLFGVPYVSETSPILPETLDQEPELESTPEIAIPPVETVAPVSTPEPNGLSADNQPSESEFLDSPQVDPSEPKVSTPEPDGKDNPGQHLGQTPHEPGDPPSQDNLNNNQDNGQDSQDKDKGKDNQNKDNSKDNKDKNK